MQSPSQPHLDFDPALIFNSMTEGVYVHDQEMVITYINPAAGRISGWQPAEALGRKCWEVFGDEAMSCRQQCPLQVTSVAGRPTSSKNRTIRHREGGRRELRVTGAPYQKNGLPAGTIVVIRDVSAYNKTLAAYQQEISDRKRVEETLARRNEILTVINYLQGKFLLDEDPQTFFDKLVDVFLSLTKSRFGFVAEIAYTPDEDLFLRCLTIRGMPPEASPHATGQSGVRPELKLTSLDNLLGAVIRSGKTVIANDPARDPRHGSLPPGHPPLSAFLGLPLFSGKTLVGMIGLSNCPDGYDQELCDHIQPAINAAANLLQAHCSERDRHAREHLLSTMADTIEEVFWICDWQTQAQLFTSQAYESVWGRSRAALYQNRRLWFEAIHADDQARVAAAFARLGEGYRFDEIYRIIRPDGGLRWIRDHGYPILNGQEVVQAAGIAQDISPWRRIEMDNARLRRQIELILGAAKTSLSVVDADFRLRYVDPTSVERYGPYEGRNCYEYFKGQTAPCTDCGMVWSLESGKPYIEETTLPREENRPVQKMVFPFVDEDGERLFAVVAIDISRSKAAESALSRSSETLALHRRLLELSFTPLSLAEIMGQCLAIITAIPWLHVLPQGAIFLKDPVQDTLVLKAHVGLNEDLAKACALVPFGSCLCGRAAQTGEVLWANGIDERHTITYAGITPHGHFCVPFFSSQRQLLGVFTVYTEALAAPDEELETTLRALAKAMALIIERKQFEAAITEARDEWALTFDAVGDMVMLTDSDYRILKVNRAMAERLGGTADQFEGGRCYHLIHESDGPIAACPHAQTLKDGGPHGCEFHEACLNGDFAVQVAPVLKDGDRVLKSVHVLHDLTERKKNELKLRQFADTQSVLLREVNHRVKNNLTAIISLLHKEEDRAVRERYPEVKSRLTDIETRIEGLLTVHSLLSASQWQPLALTDLCREVAQRVAVCMGLAPQVQITVSRSDVLVSSDQAHYLALTINELTTNTIKYAIGHGDLCHIGMQISHDDTEVRLTYHDHGPGFPAAVLQGRPLPGIGFDLIHGIVMKSLRGTLSLANKAGGVAHIAFPKATKTGGST